MDKRALGHWVITAVAVTLAAHSTWRVHLLQEDATETDRIHASQIFALSQEVDRLTKQLTDDVPDDLPEYATPADLGDVEKLARSAQSDAQEARERVDDLDGRINRICIQTQGQLCP